jgi:hypothetical protein
MNFVQRGRHATTDGPEPADLPATLSLHQQRLTPLTARAHGNARQLKRSWLHWPMWSTFLVSAISEYGLDLDLPLTPPLWLMIALSVTLFVGAYNWHHRPGPGERYGPTLPSATISVRATQVATSASVSAAAISLQTVSAEKPDFPSILYSVQSAVVPAFTTLLPLTRGPPQFASAISFPPCPFPSQFCRTNLRSFQPETTLAKEKVLS